MVVLFQPVFTDMLLTALLPSFFRCCLSVLPLMARDDGVDDAYAKSYSPVAGVFDAV